MEIVKGRLKGERFQKARSYGPGVRNIHGVVVHGTSGALKKFSTVNYLVSPLDHRTGQYRTVSYHVVIERDGTITQQVPFYRKAYHAGQSRWKGRTWLNSSFVGVALVCPGKLDQDGYAYFGPVKGEIVHKSTKAHGDGYWLPYTDEQIESLIKVCRALVEEYPDCNEIIGHHDCSPGRKIDPNPLLPWDHVRKQVFDPEIEDDEAEIPPPQVVGYDGRTMATSKIGNSQIAIGVGATVSGTITALEKVSSQVESVSSSTETLINAVMNPVTLIMAGIVMAGFVTWMERWRHKKEYGT